MMSQQQQQHYSSWSYSFSSDREQLFTSKLCIESLTSLFRSGEATASTPSILPVVLESCSHPSGVSSLFSQPYVYGGGGLGNVDECLWLNNQQMQMQPCLATMRGRDGMPPFASFCVPAECLASDLDSRDFADALRRAARIAAAAASSQQLPSDNEYLAQEYLQVYERIDELNRVLRAGWTCGEWVYPYLDHLVDDHSFSTAKSATSNTSTTTSTRHLSVSSIWFLSLWYLYIAAMMALLVGVLVGTWTIYNRKERRRRRHRPWKIRHQRSEQVVEDTTPDESYDDDDCTNNDHETRGLLVGLVEMLPKRVVVALSPTTVAFVEEQDTAAQVTEKVSEGDSTTLAAAHLSSRYSSDDTEASSSCSSTPSPSSPFSSTSSTPAPTPPQQELYASYATASSSSTCTSRNHHHRHCESSSSSQVLKQQEEGDNDFSSSFWSAFDLQANYNRLVFRKEQHSSPNSSAASSSSLSLSSHSNSLTSSIAIDTSCLHGVRVLSLCWIVLGHTAAIVSSAGAGYSNPASVLPPSGWAVTMLGQLVFSSRLAVDTFLLLSGLLLVLQVQQVKGLNAAEKDGTTTTATTSGNSRFSWWKPYVYMILSRIVRILPAYLACLGFFVFVAPRYLGGGVFWYQWAALLEPCLQHGWTNLLFVNNFYPMNMSSTTGTCFYHSWYLAVDVQLFVVGVALLAVYQRCSKRIGRALTLALCVALTLGQAWLTYVRRWSLNTFDGAAVARYDVEAYAKPHVRAPSYLVGMYCAMVLLHKQGKDQKQQQQQQPMRSTATTTAAWRRSGSSSSSRSRWSGLWRCFWTSSSSSSFRSTLLLLVCLGTMFFVTFATVSGAYARRPCQYQEWPHVDNCGSSWSPAVTFWYTAFSRTLWVVAVATLLYLLCCCQECNNNNSSSRMTTTRKQQPSAVTANVGDGLLIRGISTFLSLSIWTLPSHLSFAAYLLHPVWLFVWQLGAHQKYAWDGWWFATQYVSVCVLSLGSSLVLALWVEVPCAQFWKRWSSRKLIPLLQVPETRRTQEQQQDQEQQRHVVVRKEVGMTTYGAIECV